MDETIKEKFVFRLEDGFDLYVLLWCGTPLIILIHEVFSCNSFVGLEDEHFSSCVFHSFVHVSQNLVESTVHLCITFSQFFQSVKQGKQLFLFKNICTRIYPKYDSDGRAPSNLIDGSSIVLSASSPAKLYS